MLASVVDDGPTLKQHWVNVSCLLGGEINISGEAEGVFFSNIQHDRLDIKSARNLSRLFSLENSSLEKKFSIL